MGIISGGGVVFLLLAFSFWWYVSRAPLVETNYVMKLNDLVRPTDAEGENAWPYFKQALQLYTEPNESIYRIIQSGPYNIDNDNNSTYLAPAEQNKLRQWMEQNLSAWDLLDPEIKEQVRQAIEEKQIPQNLLTSLFKNNEVYYRTIRTRRGVRYATRPYAELNQVRKQFYQMICNNTLPEEANRALVVEVLRDWMEENQTKTRQINKWIRQNQPAWQAFATGSKKDYLFREYIIDEQSDLLSSCYIPDLKDMLIMREFSRWMIHANLQAARREQALQDSLALIRFGHLWQKGTSTFSDQLRGISIIKSGYEHMLGCIALRMGNEKDLRHIQAEIGKLTESEYPIINFEGHRLQFLDVVQHTFTKGGVGGGRIIAEYFNRWITEGASDIGLWESLGRWFEGTGRQEEMITLTDSLRHAKRDDTVAQAHRLYNRINELAQMSPFVRHDRQTSIMDDFETLDKEAYHLIHMIKRNFIDFERLVDQNFQAQALHETVTAVLALRRWKLTHGRYPDKLHELSAAGYLKKLPDDPYGPGILQYEKEGDDFILYSWAADFDDDGGVENPNDPWGERSADSDRVFWPSKNK